MVSDKNDGVYIPIFHGIDYTSWKTRILMFLKWKKHEHVVTREEITEGSNKYDHNKQTENDIKATNYIFGSVSNKQLEYIKLIPSAYLMIKKFDSMYLKESTALQIIQRNDLDNIKLKNYSTTEEFSDKFEKSVKDLKDASATVSEQETLNYRSKALPPSYSHIGDIIDVLPEEERTVEYLKSKIKISEMKDKSAHNLSENSTNSNAFNTEPRQQQKCYNCGKPGHIQFQIVDVLIIL